MTPPSTIPGNRPFAPQGQGCSKAAVADWRDLATDDGAAFDRRFELDATDVAPQVTWGTNPGHGDRCRPARVPRSGRFPDGKRANSGATALEYMGLKPGHADRRHPGGPWSSSAPAPTRGSRTCAPRPASSEGQQVSPQRPRHGGSRLAAGQDAGGSRRAGPHFQRSRL